LIGLWIIRPIQISYQIPHKNQENLSSNIEKEARYLNQTINDIIRESKRISYSASYALIIGNSKYKYWDNLYNVEKDVDEVDEALKRIGFETEVYKNITMNEFNRIWSQFKSIKGKKKDAQILFYFAGHGDTIKDATGESIGYLIMKDTPKFEQDESLFWQTALDMRKIVDDSKMIYAKHVLFMFDSCFSGSILNVRADLKKPEYFKDIEYFRRIFAKPVRQFITAGDADEQVPDRSYFKDVFIQALNGKWASFVQTGYLSAEELAYILKTQVPEYSKGIAQTHPQYGKIRDPKLDGGDFIFILNQESKSQKK